MLPELLERFPCDHTSRIHAAGILDDALQNLRLIEVDSTQEAVAVSNRYAPEHLIVNTADADDLLDAVTAAGSVFLGRWTPESLGDYSSGTNHVLPTAPSARFSSGLSVMDFLKRTTQARMTPEAQRAIGPAAERLARSESLEAHGLSVRARLDHLNR